MAEWSTAETNNFPDSSFAFIAPGGTKDSDGKTTPRSLRKLPYKDGSGAVDLPHVRNALARLDQTDGIPADKKASIQTMLQKLLKEENATPRMFRVSKIELDSNGRLPNRIMLLQSGNWPNSIKGNFEITPDDLKEIKDNFDKGIGFPSEDATTGLAIDFKHEYDDQAAAWIKGLELDTSDPNSVKLFANPVEWTDAGAAAVQGGQFKMISPSGYFGRKNGRLSAWPNPQNVKEKIANVLDGAGLTNIPFLRGMSPIRASAEADFDENIDYDKVLFRIDSQQKKGESMTIDQIRVKEKDALSADEKTFLDEHKTELSKEELVKFGYEKEEQEELSAEDRALLTPENKELLNAIASGEKVVVDKGQTTVTPERLSSLERTAEQYRDEKAKEVVELHVKRGAIKQDAADNWKKRLLAADETEREALETDLKALPSNDQLSKEFGSAEDVNAGGTAREQLHAIAMQKIELADKAGKTLTYKDALSQASRENADLLKQDLTEQTKGVN